MAQDATWFVGDIGSALEILVQEAGVALDVSDMTKAGALLIRKPDGTLATKTIIFSDDGTDGLVKYAWLSGDLNQSGTYEAQLKIISTSNGLNPGYTSIIEFDVRPILVSTV